MNKTGIIRYNLADRGRKVRGQDRHLDLPAAARLINGADVQERVREGDMIGYFGHWPRIKFGVNPAEGGIVNGQAVSVAPAIRTTFIQADNDGWVDHEVEFLDTVPGKIAARMYASKAGGFSSAINTRPVGNKVVPVGFYGFDFVLEPNYTTNRGYGVALDGVMGGDDFALDAISEAQEIMERCTTMLDSMQAQYDSLLSSHARLTQENDELLDRLARAGINRVALDAVTEVTTLPVHTQLDNADAFLSAKLVTFVEPKKTPKRADQGMLSRVMTQLGL
ncbi:hypothetical protein BJP27_23960 (plasmid) [Pseudomonas oryzihabitans]|nr:hypothetical protein BJP27_23960 [Pseudomonas psychrotolerans]